MVTGDGERPSEGGRPDPYLSVSYVVKLTVTITLSVTISVTVA